MIPKFSKNDAPNWAPGHGHSFIDFSRLKARLNCVPSANVMDVPCFNSTLELLMFEEPSDKPWEDYWPNDNYCCSNEMVQAGECNNAGSLIIPPDLPSSYARKIVVSTTTTYIVQDSISRHDISTTGVIVVFMAVCDPYALSVVVDGSIDSLDPYGYLPADLFGNLPFYGALSCAYSLVGVVWLIICALHSKELMPLQMWITAVLALGMLETTLLFAHFLNWNDMGTPSLPVTVIGLIFGVSKRALSRVVVQFVALGYGIVRPSLGEDMNRVLLLGLAYFILSLIYTVATNLPAGSKYLSDPDYDFVSLVVFMLAGVDTTFYIWIISSINNLLVTLAARKQAAKYILYRNFRAILFVSIFFTCIWALYGSIIVLNNGSGDESNWQDRWTVDALWELTYFVIFVAISVMWAPSKNSQRYAYSTELSQLEDDVEWAEAGAREMKALAKGESDDEEGVDREYGGRLHDEDDPFQGTGALDPARAIQKKA